MSLYEVHPGKFNEKLARELKKIKEFEMPEWAAFVKTGTTKIRPPADPDFWYKRAASILRQLYVRGVVGVNRLRGKFGGKKERGGKPEEFRKAGGKIIRTILQQAEQAGIVEKSEAKKKGRQLTKQGLEFLNSVAEQAKKEEAESGDRE